MSLLTQSAHYHETLVQMLINYGCSLDSFYDKFLLVHVNCYGPQVMFSRAATPLFVTPGLPPEGREHSKKLFKRRNRLDVRNLCLAIE